MRDLWARHRRVGSAIFACVAWASLGACSKAALTPHTVDRHTARTCTVAWADETQATLLIPSGVAVAIYVPPYAHPMSPLRSVRERNSCAGPARVAAPSGVHEWDVEVESAGERVKLELQMKLEVGASYELHITDESGTIGWELVKHAGG